MGWGHVLPAQTVLSRTFEAKKPVQGACGPLAVSEMEIVIANYFTPLIPWYWYLSEAGCPSVRMTIK